MDGEGRVLVDEGGGGKGRWMKKRRGTTGQGRPTGLAVQGAGDRESGATDGEGGESWGMMGGKGRRMTKRGAADDVEGGSGDERGRCGWRERRVLAGKGKEKPGPADSAAGAGTHPGLARFFLLKRLLRRKISCQSGIRAGSGKANHWNFRAFYAI